MKKLINIILVSLTVVMVFLSPVQAEIVTRDEALRVANNWITLVLQNEGAWGDSKTAAVEGIEEFKRDERTLGYFCRVRPTGYIIVSLRKELAPVKAYSATSYLDAESEEGLADMLKSDMERALNAIEKELDPIKSARTEAVQRIIEIDHRPTWKKLEADVQYFKAGLESGAIAMAYNKGTWMLSSNWHQKWPYNKECPDLGCTGSGLNGHAYVGCTATAAAQIMRYWSWPPGYDWLNMPDSVAPDSPMAQRIAVAVLCSDLGEEAGMSYGCDISTLLPFPMAGALESSFRYNAGHVFGAPHDMSSWHDFQITQLNANRPVLYGRGGENHSYVVDGWKYADEDELWVQWHINYGWKDTDNNAWYSRDYWPSDDSMVRDIRPAPSLGSYLLGTYHRNASFDYCYFDQDCTEYFETPYSTVKFEAGQNLQFLPGVRVKCFGYPGGLIRFEGSQNLSTRLFSIKGTSSAGINIDDAAIVLHPGGGIRFHR